MCGFQKCFKKARQEPANIQFFALWAVLLLCVSDCLSSPEDYGKDASLKVDSRKKGFVHVDTFFNDFVATKSPILFETGAKSYPAFEKWKVDSYFIEIPHSSTVWVTVTRQDGSREEMKLNSFFKSYNSTKLLYEGYTPSFMSVDLLYAPVLHCNDVKSLMSKEMLIVNPGLADKKLRTATRDELLCQLIGNSSMTLIDAPKQQSKLGKIGNDVDFSQVDYIELLSAKEIEHYRVNLTAGSCIYIPSKWQYLLTPKNRSFTHITSWNKRATSKLLDRKKCGEWKQIPTLVAVNFTDAVIKDDFTQDAALHFLSFGLEGGKNSFTEETFIKQMSKEVKAFGQFAKWNEEYEEIFQEVFALLDVNGDKTFSQADLDYIKKEDLPRLRELLGDRMTDIADIVQDQTAEDATVKSQTKKMKKAIDDKLNVATNSMTDGLQKQLDQMQRMAKELQGSTEGAAASEEDLMKLMDQLNTKLDEAKQKIIEEDRKESVKKSESQSNIRDATTVTDVEEGEEIIAEEDDDAASKSKSRSEDDVKAGKEKPKVDSVDSGVKGGKASKQEL